MRGALIWMAVLMLFVGVGVGQLKIQSDPVTGKVIYTPEKLPMVHGDHVSGWRIIPYISANPDGSNAALYLQVDTTSNVGPALFIVDGKGMPTSSNFDEAPLSFTSKRGSHINFTGDDAKNLVQAIASSTTTKLVVFDGHIGEMKAKHGFTLSDKQLASFRDIVSEFDKLTSQQ